jgi:hypothetical protein
MIKVLLFKVMGKKWTLKAMSKRDYREKYGKDSVAITDVNKRIIALSPKGTDLETILHEVWHAYQGEICIHSADLDEDSVEEIQAELFSKRGAEMQKLGAKLYSLVNAPIIE